MENLKKLMDSQLPKLMNSQQSLQNISEINKPQINVYDDFCEISIYTGELTMQNFAKQVIKLRGAFPKVENTFYDVLIEQAQKMGFSDERLNDAVDTLIQNFQFQTPTIANVLNFDRKIKLYTYDQMLKMLTDNAKIWNFYTSVKMFPNQQNPLWVSNNDFAKYNLEKWIYSPNK